MSAVALDVAAVRARYSALQRPLAFFDGPGGTQVPDEVIDAISGYLRESMANLGGPYETSRRTDRLLTESRLAAAQFLGCDYEEVAFGPNMTTLNFALTRTVGRTLSPGDEIVVTQLDHDANVAPWLELAHDLDLNVRVARINDDCTLDLDHLASLLGDRTRVVAFPWASNAVGTVNDVARIAALAHEAGALAWVDAVHFGPHGPMDVRGADVDVLVCSPYKFFGPHMGLAYGRADLLRAWRPYKVRPSPTEPLGQRFETGTMQFELLAGFVAAVDYIHSLGWESIVAWERELGERFLRGLPGHVRLHGLQTMDGRVPTFCFDVEGLSAEEAATRLGERDIAVWWGNYYAVEVFERLGRPDGAVRAGIVHYNTADEVDRLLHALGEL
jgi:cysteine desulfurase family protein (TIGR01976 family)